MLRRFQVQSRAGSRDRRYTGSKSYWSDGDAGRKRTGTGTIGVCKSVWNVSPTVVEVKSDSGTVVHGRVFGADKSEYYVGERDSIVRRNCYNVYEGDWYDLEVTDGVLQ